MHEQNPKAADELDFILQTAGKKIAGGVQPAEFLQWFRNSMPVLAPAFAAGVRDANSGNDTLLYTFGRALWNAMPQPSNRYRPRPLPTPNRNARCPCGSGLKYKQCCARHPSPTALLESVNLLRFVLDAHTLAALKRIDARGMEPAALDDVAQQWALSGEYKRALALLEPLFDEGTKPPRHADLLLDSLFDIWPPDHLPTRRRRLAQRLADSAHAEIAVVALQRFIVMLSDDNKMDEAWQRFHRGIRRFPEDVNFAAVEIMLLLKEGRVDDARDRVDFWVRRLKRMGSQYDDYATRLVSLVDSPEDQTRLDTLREQSPLIDEFAHQIESQPIMIDGYAAHPASPDEPFMLQANEELRKAEQRWQESTGSVKPALVSLESDDEPLDLELMLDLIQKEPAYLNSFDVLDDISASLDVTVELLPAIEPLLELVMQRAETLLLGLLTGQKPADWVKTDHWTSALQGPLPNTPWAIMENRPALRIMARHVRHLMSWHIGSAERWLPRAQVMLTINHNDNHGYRELVSGELLSQHRPSEALTLLDRYPDDGIGGVLMNRVLSLYLLDRKDEAALTLRQSANQVREMRKGITQDKYPRPRDLQESHVKIGGRDEAWVYRDDMRETWKKAGAIEWLREQAIPRQTRRRKPAATKTGKGAGPKTSSIADDATSDSTVAGMPEHEFNAPELLSLQTLRHLVTDLPEHGPWLVGLTLAAALTPGGGFDVKRLFNPMLERLSAHGDTVSLDSSSADSESDTFNKALTSFILLYQHFIARINAKDDHDQESRRSDISTLADWVADDLSVVAMHEPEIRVALISGLIASIDGNPRGWNPVPNGPMNSVIGPLRLMVSAYRKTTAADGRVSSQADGAPFTASLFDEEHDSGEMLSASQCMEHIRELVKLTRLAFRKNR